MSSLQPLATCTPPAYTEQQKFQTSAPVQPVPDEAPPPYSPPCSQEASQHYESLSKLLILLSVFN